MPTRKSNATGGRRRAAPRPRKPPGAAGTAPRVRIKRVYDAALGTDGRRVLVDRLWPRGIAKAAIAEWRPDLAPSHELRRWYAHVPARFAAFEKRYRGELADHGAAIADLRDAARASPLTLLTATREVALSHLEVLRRIIMSGSTAGAPRRRRPGPTARSPRQ
jgi:uncharacterized protein YeaO (DUF488 family)